MITIRTSGKAPWIAVDTFVECDTFKTNLYKGIHYLDVSTVYSNETNTVFINVVNRHKDNSITAEIFNNSGTFMGNAEIGSVTGDKLQEPFTFDQYSTYQPPKNISI